MGVINETNVDSMRALAGKDNISVGQGTKIPYHSQTEKQVIRSKLSEVFINSTIRSPQI